jgi:hypothetical protein
MFKTASASIALLALCNPALIGSAWAAGCASPDEASALKTAVLQQELMVAALQCHESGAYNRFVNTYRPELQSSDATLKTFFVRRGGEHGEAGYDTFKTKAANLSALEQARHGGAFCADAHVLFQAALAYRGSLMSFVDDHSGAADIGNVCVESRPAPVLARAVEKPATPVKAIAVAAVAIPAAAAAAALKPAAQVAVVGVPAHSLPAIPYRHEEAPSPTPHQAALANDTRDRDFEDREAARNDEETDDAPVYVAEEAPPPPPPPRYYPVRAQRYPSYAYGPGSYGPPQGWQNDYRPAPPPPPYWYRRGYSNW